MNGNRKARTCIFTGQAIPRWREELPFALLFASAAAAPFIVLGQGGDWTLAMFAFFAVLGIPGAAIEAMIGAARFAHLVRDGE